MSENKELMRGSVEVGLVNSYTRESNGKIRRYYTLTGAGRDAAVARSAATCEFCSVLSMLLQPAPQA